MTGTPSGPTATQWPGRSPSGSTSPAAPACPAPPPAPRAGRGLGSGKPITFAFGGDVNFEGTPRTLLAEDPDVLFAGVADALTADVTMVNLETAITERGTAVPKQFNFRAPASAFLALRSAGVDVVTLANNHGMDYGEEGLLDTLEAADDPATGLPLVGAGQDIAEAYSAFRATVRGQRISILGASRVTDGDLIDDWTVTDDHPGIAVAEDPTRLLEAVRAERAWADTLIVYLHWGRERVNCPIDDQPEMADALVAAGADVVVGSHAHVPLAGGIRDGAYVHYGLGNFLFGSAGGPTAESGVLRLTMTGRRVDAAEWVPVHLDAGVPEVLDGAEAARAHTAWEDLRPCAGRRGRDRAERTRRGDRWLTPRTRGPPPVACWATWMRRRRPTTPSSGPPPCSGRPGSSSGTSAPSGPATARSAGSCAEGVLWWPRRGPSALAPEAPLRIVGAHTDSPNLRLKPRPLSSSAGWQRLAVEVYGGPLLNSWLDRDLGLAGRVSVRRREGPAVALVHLPGAVARIPQLAVHLDREVNQAGLVLNPQQHLLPLWAPDGEAGVLEAVAAAAGCGVEDLLAWDLMLHDVQPAALTGPGEELLVGGRLDDLVSSFVAVEALAGGPEAPDAVGVVCLFDHEEVGSVSRTGAGGRAAPGPDRTGPCALGAAGPTPWPGPWPGRPACRRTWPMPPIPTTSIGTTPAIPSASTVAPS